MAKPSVCRRVFPCFPPIRWVNWQTYLAIPWPNPLGHHDPLVRCGWHELELPLPRMVLSTHLARHCLFTKPTFASAKGNIDPMLNDHGLASWLQPTSMSYTVSGFVWNRAPLNAQLNHQVPPKMGHGLTMVNPIFRPSICVAQEIWPTWTCCSAASSPAAFTVLSPWRRPSKAVPTARARRATTSWTPRTWRCTDSRWVSARPRRAVAGSACLGSNGGLRFHGQWFIDGELTQQWGLFMVFRGFDLEGLRLPTVGCLESAARDSVSHWIPLRIVTPKDVESPRRRIC